MDDSNDVDVDVDHSDGEVSDRDDNSGDGNDNGYNYDDGHDGDDDYKTSDIFFYSSGIIKHSEWLLVFTIKLFSCYLFAFPYISIRQSHLLYNKVISLIQSISPQEPWQAK